jgi:hypothetical protein
MDQTAAQTRPQAAGARSTDYVRFIILSSPRVGSNMLASALNSSRDIICFRELFNAFSGFIDFSVEGYDNASAEDRALRNRDFKEFLQRRIFCQHAEGTRAVGFKMPYVHFRFFPGLLEWLVADGDLRVLHLRRRNLLRMLVSLRIARKTGRWAVDRKGTLLSKFRPSNAARAARHPLRAADRLRRFIQPGEAARESLRGPITLSEQECRDFFAKVERDSDHYGGLFGEHPQLSLYYEDLQADRRRAFDEVQSFLGLKPRPLAITTRRQNPEPLRELIANYDELYTAFRDGPEAVFFA